MSPPAAFVRRGASRLLACSSSSSSFTVAAAARAFNNNNNIIKREFKTSSSSSIDLGAEAEELAFAPNPKHNQTFAPSDPIFMSQFVYHSDFIDSQMKECSSSSSSSHGEKECAKMLAQIGGKMRCYYKATTGEFDGLVIYSFPKNHDVHTFEQIVKSSGLIGKMYTTKLMTSEDANTALKAAKDLVDKYGGGGL